MLDLDGFKSSATDGIAIQYMGLHEEGAVFRTESHPDRLDYILIYWRGVLDSLREWKGEDHNVIYHGEQGDRLFIPAGLMQQLSLDMQFRNGLRA